MHWIDDDLGVSGLHDLHMEHPVGAVLNVCERRPYEPPAHLPYLHRGFQDEQPFPIGIVWECVQWLDRQLADGRKALVHCAEGDAIKRQVLERKPFAQLGGMPIEQRQYFQDAFFARWQRFLARAR